MYIYLSTHLIYIFHIYLSHATDNVFGTEIAEGHHPLHVVYTNPNMHTHTHAYTRTYVCRNIYMGWLRLVGSLH